MENFQEGNAKLAELNGALTSIVTGLENDIPAMDQMPVLMPQAMRQASFVVVGGVAVG